MVRRPNHSEAETLERYRVALENVGTQTQIATIMAEFGYDTETIAIGKGLWQTAYNAYTFKKTEEDETNEAYADFSAKKEDLTSFYSMHRKKAKVIFRKDPIILEKIGIKGNLSQAYIKWLEVVKKFYTVVSANTVIQEKLVRLKISPEDISAGNTKVRNLENARAMYLKDRGESQDATAAKDNALAEIDDWMYEFYAVATIALEDHPQLLEALSKAVKK